MSEQTTRPAIFCPQPSCLLCGGRGTVAGKTCACVFPRDEKGRPQ